MSRIDELIEKLCPDGVEWKTIEDVCKNIVSGGTPLTSRTEYYNGSIPWLRTQEVDWIDIHDTGIKITEAGLKNSSAKLIPENCVIVAMYGATAAKVAVNKIPLCTNQACCNLEIDEKIANYRYVYYWLCNSYNHLRSLGEGSQSNINGQKIKSYKIPIPPLEIQNEIVKTLDLFTELKAELEAELEARKTQYTYYRDALLSFEGKDVEWKTLGEIAKFRRGSFPQPYGNKEWYDGDEAMPFVQVADVGSNLRLVQNTKQKISKLAQPKSVFVPKGTVIVTLQGSIGRVAITDYDSYVDRTLAIFESFQIEINKRYFAYQLSKKFEYEKEYARGSTLKTITKEEFTKFQIPIPSLSEQERIVAILDKFDALVNDISIGLPAEIETRRKQYEYYRNKLLTFKNVNNG